MFLSKRSNGIYYVIYTNSLGKRNRISTRARLKSDAVKFLSKFQEDIKQRESSKTVPICLSKFSFEYLRYSESIHTYKTTITFKQAFRFLLEFLGDVQLLKIDHSALTKYFEFRINRSSIYQAKKDYACLSSSFNYATQNRYLIMSPMKDIKKFKVPEKRPVCFDEISFQRLLNIIDDNGIKDLVIFSSLTGLRQMEAISLIWEQIDFEDGVVILDNRNGHITKSKRVRVIPLPIKCIKILTNRQENKSDDNYVFTYKDLPIKQDFIIHRFKKYIRKAGLDDRLNYHSLRHYYITQLLKRGANIHDVSKLAGHSSVLITDKIYNHFTTDDLRRSVNLLNN